jgi:hypothetical protein
MDLECFRDVGRGGAVGVGRGVRLLQRGGGKRLGRRRPGVGHVAAACLGAARASRKRRGRGRLEQRAGSGAAACGRPGGRWRRRLMPAAAGNCGRRASAVAALDARAPPPEAVATTRGRRTPRLTAGGGGRWPRGRTARRPRALPPAGAPHGLRPRLRSRLLLFGLQQRYVTKIIAQQELFNKNSIVRNLKPCCVIAI